MQLLIDEAFLMDSEVLEELNESGQTKRNYYISGTFSTPDVKNRNGRIYSTQLWESNVNAYQEHIKNNTKYTLGENEHPARVDVDPMKAVMKITSLKMEEGVVKGRAKILNNGSAETNQIKALIDEGMKIGVSSRGTGRLGKGNIVEEFQLSTYDIVTSPSDYNAELNGMSESIEKHVSLNENTGKYICDDKGCIFKEETETETETEISEGTSGSDIAQDEINENINTNTLKEFWEAAENLGDELKNVDQKAGKYWKSAMDEADKILSQFNESIEAEAAKKVDVDEVPEPETACTKGADSLIELFTKYTTPEVELTETEKLAISLVKRKVEEIQEVESESTEEIVTESPADAAQEIEKALKAGKKPTQIRSTIAKKYDMPPEDVNYLIDEILDEIGDD